MSKVSVGLSGYREIRKKLGPELWREAFPKLIQAVADIGAKAMRAGAPKGKTGDAEAGISVRLTTGKFPSARIVDTAKHGRYPYVTLLEFATKYHHRAWAEDAVLGELPAMNRALDDAARDIEAVWQA